MRSGHAPFYNRDMAAAKKVLIVGAGPGGLSAGLLLAHRGFDVEIFEKGSQPGGRTSELRLGEYRFDVGPTFFMMKEVLDSIFAETGRKPEDYMEFIRLAPMYRLILPDGRPMDVFEDRDAMRKELDRVFPGEGAGLDRFYAYEKKRYDRLMPILKHHNNNWLDVFSPRTLRGAPFVSFGKSLYEVMGRYFKTPLARLSFTFQSKYLGMSPWECPGAFGLVPYIEHADGVYHVKGGLSTITRQMAKVAEEEGARIRLNTPVKRVIVEHGRAVGVETAAGDVVRGDEVIVNADFGYAASNLFDPGVLRKYAPAKLAKKKLSCSIFLMYLGVNAQYRLPHNTIVFAEDYERNVRDVFAGRLSGDNMSFYVRDTSTTDPELAPRGKSALYVLVPVPNELANIDWDAETPMMRKRVLAALEKRLGMEGIEERIEEERIVTPKEWRAEFNVHKGAVFNLAHNLSQMIWMRPHNKFEEVDHCYLVGGGTHPGSGLPTIMESGRIAADLIGRRNG